MQTPNAIPITDWLTAIGTIGTVIVALFLSVVRKWYMRPKFEIEFANEEPFCKHANNIMGTDPEGRPLTVPAFWIRLRVWNKGRSIARGCEGKLVRITQMINMQDRRDFDPVVLHWVGTPHGPPHPIDINRGESEYLDIVCTIQNSNTYHIPADEIEPRAINLSPPRQDYIFHVVLYGANVKPLPRDLHLKNDIQFDKIRLEQVS